MFILIHHHSFTALIFYGTLITILNISSVCTLNLRVCINLFDLMFLVVLCISTMYLNPKIRSRERDATQRTMDTEEC